MAQDVVQLPPPARPTPRRGRAGRSPAVVRRPGHAVRRCVQIVERRARRRRLRSSGGAGMIVNARHATASRLATSRASKPQQRDPAHQSPQVLIGRVHAGVEARRAVASRRGRRRPGRARRGRASLAAGNTSSARMITGVTTEYAQPGVWPPAESQFAAKVSSATAPTRTPATPPPPGPTLRPPRSPPCTRGEATGRTNPPPSSATWRTPGRRPSTAPRPTCRR